MSSGVAVQRRHVFFDLAWVSVTHRAPSRVKEEMKDDA